MKTFMIELLIILIIGYGIGYAFAIGIQNSVLYALFVSVFTMTFISCYLGYKRLNI